MDVLINPTAESYGVDADTLREWLNGLPASIFEKEIPVPTTKTEIKNEPQSEEIPTLENENSVYEDDDEKYQLLVDMFKLIRVSFRVLLTVFIVILCVALTAHLINNDIDEIEKNHLPYTLLCMLTGDNFNKQE